jgi:uncharacterized phiE125 gp8 family phage protein
MSLVLVTPPATEPLSLQEVRTHLRLDATNVEPAPASLLAALASLAGNVDVGTHRYCLTFVTADGETQAGDESNVVTVTVSTNARVALTEIPTGGALVTARKLYRTKAGLNVFYLLATIADNTTTTYTDNIADASLGAEVPTENTTGDTELAALIAAVRVHVENDLRRALITQQWRYRLSSFPDCVEIALPKTPVISIDSVTYLDTDGVSQTLATNQYDTEIGETLPNVIHRAYNVTWPSVQASRVPVSILFTAGYGPAASDVPLPIRHAMKLMIGELYENRESVNVGNIVNVMPAYDRLLSPYRVRWFV